MANPTPTFGISRSFDAGFTDNQDFQVPYQSHIPSVNSRENCQRGFFNGENCVKGMKKGVKRGVGIVEGRSLTRIPGVRKPYVIKKVSVSLMTWYLNFDVTEFENLKF